MRLYEIFYYYIGQYIEVCRDYHEGKLTFQIRRKEKVGWRSAEAERQSKIRTYILLRNHGN